jgi:hypothetical protein
MVVVAAFRRTIAVGSGAGSLPGLHDVVQRVRYPVTRDFASMTAAPGLHRARAQPGKPARDRVQSAGRPTWRSGCSAWRSGRSARRPGRPARRPIRRVRRVRRFVRLGGRLILSGRGRSARAGVADCVSVGVGQGQAPEWLAHYQRARSLAGPRRRSGDGTVHRPRPAAPPQPGIRTAARPAPLRPVRRRSAGQPRIPGVVQLSDQDRPRLQAIKGRSRGEPRAARPCPS